MPVSAKRCIFAAEKKEKLAERVTMEYISVMQFAEKFGISERTARNYCASGKIEGALAKQLHLLLKTGTSDSRKDWFAVGEYKRLANEVGGQETCSPKEVHRQMKALLSEYHRNKHKALEDILDFHVRFEQIHPFQDGNGRVGRLLMFKECLANGIVPFIITDDLKLFYYRGLREWGHINGFLTDTCLTAQDQYKSLLDYFKIKH